MLKPAYKLTIGGKVVDTTDEPKASTVVDLAVYLDLDTPADAVQLTLGSVGFLKPKQDDDATIELGYADNGGVPQGKEGERGAPECRGGTKPTPILTPPKLFLCPILCHTSTKKKTRPTPH